MVLRIESSLLYTETKYGFRKACVTFSIYSDAGHGNNNNNDETGDDWKSDTLELMHSHLSGKKLFHVNGVLEYKSYDFIDNGGKYSIYLPNANKHADIIISLDGMHSFQYSCRVGDVVTAA